MEKQICTKVVIDGKVYNLSGQAEEAYLQRLASHVNHTITLLKEQGGLQKQASEIRNLQIFLQLADDYLKQKDAADETEAQLHALETQIYDLKHSLISSQMQLEQLKNFQEEAEHLTGQLAQAEERAGSLQIQTEDLRAQIQLLTESNRALESKNRALTERYTQLKNRKG